MSDYDEYDYGDDDREGDDYGDDYGDYGDEGEGDDYGDDDFGDDYEYREEKEMDFSYRDIGAEGRVGGPIDEDLDLHIGTVIQGGALGKFQQQFAQQHLSPYEFFAISVQKFLREENLNFSDNDKSIIKRTISKLPFIKYKNPTTFILGYYIQSDISLGAMKTNKYLGMKFKRMNDYIQTDPSITMFEIMKYARYWKMILLRN